MDTEEISIKLYMATCLWLYTVNKNAASMSEQKLSNCTYLYIY